MSCSRRSRLDLDCAELERKPRNFLGHKFCARGYFVSTVGRNEEMIRAYIRDQEIADKQLDQLQLKLAS
jgi:putative transposase